MVAVKCIFVHTYIPGLMDLLLHAALISIVKPQYLSIFLDCTAAQQDRSVQDA